LLQDLTGVTFHVEHVIPRSVGGKTVLSNLALSCPGCNLAKSNRVMSVDLSGEERMLFNPRAYEPWLLGWHLHFALEHETGRILALSPTGAATIRALRMNDRARALARRLQISIGLLA
jgi:hypothetical protein